jgi:hypothetical protein
MGVGEEGELVGHQRRLTTPMKVLAMANRQT